MPEINPGYQQITGQTQPADNQTDDQRYEDITEDTLSNSDSNIFKRSVRLYFWYANNPSFWSGQIKVIGHPSYRIGNRLRYKNPFGYDWEYYIEGVEHQFNFQEGYTTTLQVTRGLRITNKYSDGGRFSFLRNELPPKTFKGGFLGEMSFEEVKNVNKVLESRKKKGRRGGGGGNSNVLEAAKSMLGYFYYSSPPAGDIGDPKNPNPNGGTDCSGFVWLCFKKSDTPCPDGGWYTGSMRDDARGANNWLKEISEDEVGKGSLVIYNVGSGSGSNGHVAVISSDDGWKGNDTEIIEMGGDSSSGVHYGKVGTSFTSLLGGDRCLCNPV